MPIPDALMHDFSRYLTQHIGWCFPPGRWADLERGMTGLAQARGFAEPETCMCNMMATSPDQADVEMLAMYLSVGETYFFRDPALFDVLEQQVLPALILERRASGNRQLKIWSAGCCSGEELYSLAILLARLLPDRYQWNLQLLGTDINPDFLAKATRGVYRDWSFRNMSSQIKQRYFTEIEDGGYAILPTFKQGVTFQYHNLASGAHPRFKGHAQGIDLIICRNVLMYFDTAQMRQAASQLHRSLIDGGWLIVSSVESGNQVFSQFQQTVFPDALLYRKVANPPLQQAALESHQPDWVGVLRPALEAAPAPGVPSARIAPGAPTAPDPALPQQAETPTTAATPSPSVTPPYEIALRHYERGEYQEVAAALQSGDQTCPANLLLLARAYANLGDLEAALHWSSLALAADKCNPALRYLVALIHEERGQYDDAITSLKHAIYLDPEFALAHFGLGSAYQRQGKMHEARRHFNNAVNLLRKTPASQIVTESEGVTAGHLMEIIQRKERAL